MKGTNVSHPIADRFMTINEIIDDMHANLPEEDLKFLKETPEDQLIKFHFGVGMRIRNFYRLWDEANPYVILGEPESPFHPDQVSQAAIEGLWAKLQQA